MRSTLAVTVAETTDLAVGVRGLTLVAEDGGPLPPWSAGSHIDVHLPSGLVRQYSLCGDPADPERYQIAVLRDPGSRGGSVEVHDALRVGARLTVGVPRNRFPLEDAGSYLFLAGGIGITPLLPMVAEVAGRGLPWRLVYGGRHRGAMAFLHRVESWSSTEVWPQDERGLMDLAALLPAEDTAMVYVCGPAPLLAAVDRRCAEVGRTAHLRTELFGAPGTDADVEVGTVDGVDPETGFEVQLGVSGPVLVVGACTSILQTLLDAEVDVLFSCEEGTCGSCETTVLAGEPDHRDSLLTDAERAAGSMLICVSRCRGDRLVLDVDA